MFSPKLLRWLEEDYEAQAKVAGEIVGLDYDPFLFSQDPCERYVAESVTYNAEKCFVDVHSVCQGRKSAKADVVPELTYQDGSWIFLNFHYGINDSAGLLGNLKSLRDERKQDQRKSQ